LSASKKECIFKAVNSTVAFEDELTGDILTLSACPDNYKLGDLNACEIE